MHSRLRDLGFDVTLREPDDQAPLNGVLVVAKGSALVEVVNIRADWDYRYRQG